MFEQVIRPFETPNTINDRQSVVSTVIKASAELAVIAWGAAGTNPTPVIVGAGLVIKADKNYKEIDRKTTDVKIENPNDSGQFVITKRIDEITFQRKLPPPSGDNNSGMSNGVDSNTAYANPPTGPVYTGGNPLATGQVNNVSTPTTESDKYTLHNPAPPA